jgi:hypothetical protein
VSGRIIGKVHRCQPTDDAGKPDEVEPGTVWECSCGKRWVVVLVPAFSPASIDHGRRRKRDAVEFIPLRYIWTALMPGAPVDESDAELATKEQRFRESMGRLDDAIRGAWMTPEERS